MATITLQDIRDAAEQKYGSYRIDGIAGGDVLLTNILRLDDDKFAKAVELQEGLADANPMDALAMVKDLLALVTTPDMFNRLMSAIGDDRAVLMEVITGYSEATQLGEAQPSAE